jgi:hypothetical protein
MQVGRAVAVAAHAAVIVRVVRQRRTTRRTHVSRDISGHLTLLQLVAVAAAR